MEVVPVSYLPGDPMLIDKIVCELKSQGIFDSFRRECISDVDTKPAYQNLRQRVETSVSSFLRKQRWRPDMNKNQVREMLRKNIIELGYLETGVERIVDQVVNPKINTIFLPKVTDVVYKYLGIERPNYEEIKEVRKPELKEICIDNILPRDIESVTPEFNKKSSFITNHTEQQVYKKPEEDESPAFEPIKKTPVYNEENSVDSHLSGFSGLMSHDSNHSDSQKALQIDMDTQMSKQSSEGRISSEDQSSKMEICEDSRQDSNSNIDTSDKSSNSAKFEHVFEKEIKDDSNEKIKKEEREQKDKKRDEKKRDDKDRKERDDRKDRDKHRSTDRHRSRTESHSDRRDRDRKDKDKRSSRDRDKQDKRSSRDRDRKNDRNHTSHSSRDNDRHRSSSSKNSSSLDKSSSSSSKKDSHRDKDKRRSDSRDKKDNRDKDKYDSKHKERNRSKEKHSSSSSSKDSKSRDDKNRSSHSSNDRKSSSSSSRHEKDRKDPKKTSKDDHYSSKHRLERRSTDRDSNDGSGLKSSSSSYSESNSSSQNSTSQVNKQGSLTSNSNDSGNSDSVEQTHPTEGSTLNVQEMRLIKPKIASNIFEVRRIMKIRKQLKKLEQQNALSLNINQNTMEELPKIEKPSLQKDEEVEIRAVTPPLSISVSMSAWDALEAKLNESMNFNTYYDPEVAETSGSEEPQLDVTPKPLINENITAESSVYNDKKVEEMENETAEVTIEPKEEEVKLICDYESLASLEDSKDCQYFTSESVDQSEKVQKQYLLLIDKLKQDIQEIETNVALSICNNIPNSNNKENHQVGSKRKLSIQHEGVKKTKNNNHLYEGDINQGSLNGLNTEILGRVKYFKYTVTSDEKFPLPLSPSDSDKSVDKRQDPETPVPKQRRTKVQRYSSDDLYKPRPVIKRSSTRNKESKVD